MNKFVKVDVTDNDLSFAYVNPSAIALVEIIKTLDEEFPYEVIHTTVANEEIMQEFSSLEEARHYILRLGGND